MSKILIIGGGAAGMMASVFAAEAGHEVHVFEQNEKLGKKLFITGKGRCNFTNDCPVEDLFKNVVTNPKFLYSAFYGFDSQQAIRFFEELGVPTKTERGGRAFPVSDHSSDIILAMERRMKALDVKIHLKSKVRSVDAEDGAVTGVTLENGARIAGDRVLVATGGISYPSTGATGDGYRFAEETGHSVTQLSPSLVPLKTEEAYIPRLQGLSLKNVRLSVQDGKKKLFDEFGEMLFTHCGISGPLALSASAYAGNRLGKGPLKAWIDLKPALSAEQLDARLLRMFSEAKNKQFKNALHGLFPAKLTPVMIDLSGIPEEKKVNEISRQERMGFAELIKAFPLTITGTGEYKEAIITRGGVSVRDVNPKTMESRRVKGLYFAGEVLDVDAVTGGYNLQIAWSTAYAAAQAF